MVTYPKGLRSILSSMYLSDLWDNKMSYDDSILEATLLEFRPKNGTEVPYGGDKMFRENKDGEMHRYHAYKSTTKASYYLLDVKLPPLVDKFSRGDDTKIFSDFVLPLSIGFCTQTMKRFMTDNDIDKRYDEKGLIEYYKRNKIFLHKLYLEDRNSMDSRVEAGREYIIPNAIIFPDETSLCWHMYTEQTRKGTVLNIVEHVVTGNGKYNQNWESIRNTLHNVATNFDGTGRSELGLHSGREYLQLKLVDPLRDRSWRPNA